MGREQLSKFVNQFKRVMSPERVNELGRTVRFCRRERVITPYRLAVSLLASCATMRVESLADIQRCFNALFGTTVAYKPFHNQLAKWRFGGFMRELVSVILEQWVVRVLSVGTRGAFSEFRRIVIQDGSSFAVKDALCKHYPGRFKHKGPAAVELHVTMNLLDESVSRVVLTPDTHPERPELPAPQELAGDLLLADRGYFDVEYLRLLDAAGASFVVRGYTSINPMVLDAFAPDGARLKRLCGKRLKDNRLPKKGTLDLDVAWGTGERTFRTRVLASWNPAKREYRFLVTNLARNQYTPEQVAQAYRLRWQIELLFKEWKSYANLHAFDTRNATLAEGLIWAAIAAAAMKRYFAHMTQVLHGVEISTRKVAMCAHHVLAEVFHLLATGQRRKLGKALQAATNYLAVNAARAHPKRDRYSGRLQLGLTPILGGA
jgi:hypothetical protein